MQPQCSCIICKKVYSIKGIHSHYTITHTDEGKLLHASNSKVSAIEGGKAYAAKMKKLSIEKELEYNKNPKLCPNCNNSIPFKIKNNKFCSQSCAATYTNKNKSYDKIKQTWANKPKQIKFKPIKIDKITKSNTTEPRPQYCTVYNCTCKHCNSKILSRSMRKYCDNCQHLYSHEGRAKYWFTFNVFHYPELFDLSLIMTFGFRDSKTNPNGITRDHRVSVNEAIRNNYDPFYIKHPLNCELMFFEENNKKKTNSSITYEELKKTVDAYEINGPSEDRTHTMPC